MDNAATAKPNEQALNEFNRIEKNFWGNPSSLHEMGFLAEEEIKKAKKTIAKKLNANINSVYFTSGGTESNNTAILGAVKKTKHIGKHIVTTQFEHSSVLNPIKKLESEGYSVTYLSPESKGYISREQILNAVKKDTCLVSVMAVNNETGALNEVFGILKDIKKISPDCFFHSDCIQAFLKVGNILKAEDFDLISVSGHKIGAVKGIGALIVNKEIPPLLLGGGQQKGMRSGTVPAGLICSFAKAAEVFGKNTNAENTVNNGCKETKSFDYINHINHIYNYCLEQLKSHNYHINYIGPTSKYIINFSVKNIKSETMLHFLESKGIYVSSGSACSKGKKSNVLKALNLSDDYIDFALRISFCNETAKEDIDKLILSLEEAEKVLVKIKR